MDLMRYVVVKKNPIFFEKNASFGWIFHGFLVGGGVRVFVGVFDLDFFFLFIFFAGIGRDGEQFGEDQEAAGGGIWEESSPGPSA